MVSQCGGGCGITACSFSGGSLSEQLSLVFLDDGGNLVNNGHLAERHGTQDTLRGMNLTIKRPKRSEWGLLENISFIPGTNKMLLYT